MLTILVLAAATWIGGLPTPLVVRRAAMATLGEADNVALFRAIGRSYGKVAGASLIVAAAAGAWLCGAPSTWERWQATCAVFLVLLMLATAAGVRHARSLTRLRQAAIGAHDPSLERSAG